MCVLFLNNGNLSCFHQECQKKLEHKLGLDSYLLKPVQRITKYQLLLKVPCCLSFFSILHPHPRQSWLWAKCLCVADCRRCLSTVRPVKGLMTCKRRWPPSWESSRLSMTPCTSSPLQDMRWGLLNRTQARQSQNRLLRWVVGIKWKTETYDCWIWNQGDLWYTVMSWESFQEPSEWKWV